MNHEFIVDTPALRRTGVARATDDTQGPAQGSDAEPETPDPADDPTAGQLVDGLSR